MSLGNSNLIKASSKLPKLLSVLRNRVIFSPSVRLSTTKFRYLNSVVRSPIGRYTTVLIKDFVIIVCIFVYSMLSTRNKKIFKIYLKGDRTRVNKRW